MKGKRQKYPTSVLSDFSKQRENTKINQETHRHRKIFTKNSNKKNTSQNKNTTAINIVIQNRKKYLYTLYKTKK